QIKVKSKKSQSVCYSVIFFIVVNEFCERFSYYGMRAVLVLYFRYFLKWDDDLATSIYHTFIALCYLTPILGAIVADSWLGKFKTIVYLSIVYTVGQVVMAVSAIHDITDTDRDGTPDNMTFHVAMSMLGLFLIALGTGGIKPCVAAFGGDQFEDHQEKQRSTFFSIFYLSINAGSLLSTVITPILRAQECGIHSQQKCYPLAFGVPAALMVVALIVFIMGSGMYNKTAPKGNIMLEVCKCIGFAIKNRFRHRSKKFPKREHWMDWADEKYDKLLVAQVKMVLKVLFLYIPLPMFWTLFDQQVRLLNPKPVNLSNAIQVVEDVKPNTIHMGWQIPQYFLMTAGEVVFSVTGLEFSYSQAPSNMKSVLQAGWLFTVAVGNIIVLIVAEAAQLPDQWAEYILFASLLVVVCIVFAVMSYFYTYTDPAEIEAEFKQPEHEPEEKKRDSVEMESKDLDCSKDSDKNKRDSVVEQQNQEVKQSKM
uniref:Solute carrier family 15 member 1b n=1 Tax=Hucho hucho TaxID=62062 RepID=A0A4W5Q023_9TELE